MVLSDYVHKADVQRGKQCRIVTNIMNKTSENIFKTFFSLQLYSSCVYF